MQKKLFVLPWIKQRNRIFCYVIYFEMLLTTCACSVLASSAAHENPVWKQSNISPTYSRKVIAEPWSETVHILIFRRWQNCEKRLLASSLLPVSLYVLPSARIKSLPRDEFSWNFLSIFRISVEKFQIPLKSDKNNSYTTWRPLYIFGHISLNSS